MKSNPFYALSASAMLLGCWLLSEALHLQAGQVAGLLVLMLALQLYEGLLVVLGAFLVRTGRAPRDGVTVLLLESVFLLDAPLLAAECVTASAPAGTTVVVALAALAAAKLGWVRRAAPGLVSRRAALLLGVQAVLVLALPVGAAHLASARAFSPRALYAFWWATMALPLVRRRLQDETSRPEAVAPPPAAWTWVPAAMVLLHLWAVGYIHAIEIQPAFYAPFLLGLALAARPHQMLRQVALPGLAVLASLGQAASLGLPLFGAAGPIVAPPHVAGLALVVTWAYLAWRHRRPWLALLSAGAAVAGGLATWPQIVADALARVLKLLDSAMPRGTFGWGVLTVIAAFVLLGAGARRSLAENGCFKKRSYQSR